MIRSLAAFAVAFGLAAPAAHADDVKIVKIATLAPEGSAWMKQFHAFADVVLKRSNGKLKIKYYAGGVAGDERDAVRKMRLGQINGAAVTAVGLGLIQPEVRALELPFLLHGYDELDYVRGTLDAELRKKFEEKGYVLMGWGDVGPVHLFTNVPVKSKADLQQTKIWAWTDDPIVRGLFQQLGLNGVPLGVPDVLPALQTGLINACYGSPLSTLALQWHTKVKYITSMVIAQSIGAAVVTKQTWDSLSPDLQKMVLEEGKVLEKNLLKISREDNETSLKKMKELGLQEIPTPPEVQKEFEAQGKAVAAKLEGQLYSKEFRAKVEKLLADKRAGKK
jgi:TRAP-type C4-dicarboxylate transport system substrate-binding protein